MSRCTRVAVHLVEVLGRRLIRQQMQLLELCIFCRSVDGIHGSRILLRPRNAIVDNSSGPSLHLRLPCASLTDRHIVTSRENGSVRSAELRGWALLGSEPSKPLSQDCEAVQLYHWLTTRHPFVMVLHWSTGNNLLADSR